MTPEQEKDIFETLGRLDERTLRIDHAVSGNGQPGLVQRVDALETINARAWGAAKMLTVLGSASGIIYKIFHWGR